MPPFGYSSAYNASPSLQGLANAGFRNVHQMFGGAFGNAALLTSLDPIEEGCGCKTREKLGYKTPELEKCCAKCAFSSDEGNASWSCKDCAYLRAADRFREIGEVSDYGVCNHFISTETVKLLKQCASPEELDMKLTIFGITLDDLLAVEIKDGFECGEKATRKMLERMENVSVLLETSKDAVDIPLMVRISNASTSGKIPLAAVSRSTNFSRVNAYLKNTADAFNRKTNARKWSDYVDLAYAME